jgi:uncharacterized protein with PIN domain
MPTPKTVLKARLLAAAEAAIDELLAQKKAPETATLADIEHVVLKAGQTWEQVLTAELLKESGRSLETPWPTCPTCGARLQAKGKRPRRVATETGEAEVTRDYYYCLHCRKGIFPPG